MAQARSQIARPKPPGGTRVGNGLDILPGVDGRSAGARRYRELCADLFAHVGGDPSAAQEMLIRRSATLGSWLETQEAAFARAEAFDLPGYATGVNVLHRLLTTLGIQRTARDASPGSALATYLASRPVSPVPEDPGL